MVNDNRFDRSRRGRPDNEGIRYGDMIRRYDELIADAEGDAPLRRFWQLGKRLFQTDYATDIRPDLTENRLFISRQF